MIVLSNTICAIPYVFLFHIYVCMHVCVFVCIYMCVYVYVCVGVYVQIHICIKNGRERLGGRGGGRGICLNTSSRVDQDTRRPFSLAKQRRLHVISITD